MINQNTRKFSLRIFSFLFIALFIYGCDYSDDGDSDDGQEDQAKACNQKGQHQAYCLYKEALATTDIRLCDKIDVDLLSKAEKSSELRDNIPVVKDKCIFEVSIKANDPSRCKDIADSKHQYNGDVCLFQIAQANNNLKLCLLVTPAGRINEETKYVFNQANCVSELKAKLTSVGCGEGEPGIDCIISLGAAKYSLAVCDEYFKNEGNEECKTSVRDLMNNIEKAPLSAWAK